MAVAYAFIVSLFILKSMSLSDLPQVLMKASLTPFGIRHTTRFSLHIFTCTSAKLTTSHGNITATTCMNVPLV